MEVPVLESDAEKLKEISEVTGAGLELQEMEKVREYFKEKKRNPTDVELQALGQAWSEHCSYKTSMPILKEVLLTIEAPQNMVVVEEDAGVVDFDNDHAYVIAFESHNHPSAIEPYGGAATGIGGILRDVVCMGAQPVALVDPLFFGLLDYQEKLPKGVKHPKFLFSGVVAGIRDYGNRVGIPTVAGEVFFHNGYLSNCIVNVGCVGVVKKEEIIHSRVGSPGDYFILVGGRTGRDGIHGVTFASAELHENSEHESRSAVQVGDPILKEPLIHACLEANKKKLLTGMKDLGGGGLSCAVGEMAYAAGYGAEVSLDEVPLKEKGMHSWEIWISESQERMMLSVDTENVEEVKKIFEKWDVPCTVIGKVIPEKILRITHNGTKILEMELDFLTKSPRYRRPYIIREITPVVPNGAPPDDYTEILLLLLSSPNICSKDWVIRQYDHEVRGSTVIKPLQGKIGDYTHGDAAVIKPLRNSYRGLAITADVNPRWVEIDPYWGAASAVDEVCRNLVSVGASPHSLADCLNFGNPEKPERLGDFVQVAKGLHLVASVMGISFVSGNVSFYNESHSGAIPPTPTLLGVGIVTDIRNAVTADLKEQGNSLYHIGKAEKEMGGSEYYEVRHVYGNQIPRTDPHILKSRIRKLLQAIDNQIIASCHDVSHGGLAVCVSEMALGGNVGVNMSVNGVKEVELFSESNSRWVVEVRKGKEKEFEKLFGKDAHKLGEVTGKRIVIGDIDISLTDVRHAWETPLWRMMG
ncbi:MAG: phosphoribosylformylglycinamidine synthase subunit PurL [Theionarchaea archaeon]|nr:MAG: phosphoribosylformylglycinamidine synthase [Theionarchaea archaeon DG-70-1]MBU7027901.1 phosphoribosylformylglycinamidine synthase subunit PurL [Theionarchaea archaeon]